ncbi:AGAP000791-PA-like protein [Anopheles sinensis]|uniref:AGAP000791-PA-like protein n=1 Tax=Anopheles sinensis TaxID=74873 RepID=A0A084VFK1_ANOSI|nr:AGAP000791-PA-like protein [Anopheles sinensis]
MDAATEEKHQQDCEMVDVEESKDVGRKMVYNKDSVLQKIANLYAERLMSDVTLVVGKNRYPAHRIILCASSDVFHVMLMNATWREFGDAVVTLQEEEKCHGVFPQFLRYMYVGQMTISVDTVVYILKLADKYNIRDLVQLCVDYMKEHLNKAAANGCFVEWLDHSLLICPERRDLITLLENYLKWNLELVVAHNGWLDLSPGIMHWLLQQNDLAIRSEYRLYELVERWFWYQKRKIESRTEMRERERENALNSITSNVLVYIRFPMMRLIEMANVLVSPSLRELKEFVVARVADGMNFHSERTEVIAAARQTEYGEQQFTPRLYTCDLWSLGIAVNFFDNMEKYSSFPSMFFSPRNFIDSDSKDEECDGWDVEFFPLGVRYKPAQLIGVYSATSSRDIPESIIRTVRLRVTCQASLICERRYMIGVLIAGMMNDQEYVHTCHVRMAYFSNDQRVVNIDNLIPFEELQQVMHSPSRYLVGERQDTIKIQVVIVPLNPFSNLFTPQLE